MANTVAYPVLALEKINGSDSSEDPTAFKCLLEKYKYRYKLVEALLVGQKVLFETHKVRIGRSHKLCELRSGPYTVTKVITKV